MLTELPDQVKISYFFTGIIRVTEVDKVFVGHISFERVKDIQFRYPFKVSDENFIVIESISGGLTEKSGMVSYPQKFIEFK